MLSQVLGSLALTKDIVDVLFLNRDFETLVLILQPLTKIYHKL